MKDSMNIEFYSTKFNTCRIDIKNSFRTSNSIKLLKCSDKNVSLDYPKWYKDNKGVGMVIHSNEHAFDLTIKCVNSGTLSIYLRGPDIRDETNARIPYYISYSSFKINKTNHITQERLVSHDKPFLIERKVRDGEILNIHVEWSTDNIKMDISKIFEFTNILKNLIKENEEKNNIIETYNYLFNSLFLNFDLKPLPLFDNLKKASLELLKFVDNICKKYELSWWLDYGTLLGAVKYGGYIPWENSINIGMARKDGEKLFSIIKKEIKENNLNDNTYISFKNNPSWKLTEGAEIYNKMDGKQIIASVDVSFYDFTSKLSNIYENINKEYDKYMVVSIDGDLKSYESKNVFPLSQIDFEGKAFPCPKNYNHYLEILYGSNCLQIPQVVKFHNRTIEFRDDGEISSDFKEYFKCMKKINRNFK